jgi:hypothetical protein
MLRWLIDILLSPGRKIAAFVKPNDPEQPTAVPVSPRPKLPALAADEEFVIDVEIELRKLLTDYDACIRGEGASGFTASEFHEALMEILLEITDPQKLAQFLKPTVVIPQEGIRTVIWDKNSIRIDRSQMLSEDGVLIRVRPTRLKHGPKQTIEA